MYIDLVWGAEINGWPFKKLKMLLLFPMVYPALSSNVASWEIPKLNVWFSIATFDYRRVIHHHWGIWWEYVYAVCLLPGLLSKSKMQATKFWGSLGPKEQQEEVQTKFRQHEGCSKSSKILCSPKSRSREPGVASGSSGTSGLVDFCPDFQIAIAARPSKEWATPAMWCYTQFRSPWELWPFWPPSMPLPWCLNV